jgi:hypothetical protein
MRQRDPPLLGRLLARLARRIPKAGGLGQAARLGQDAQQRMTGAHRSAGSPQQACRTPLRPSPGLAEEVPMVNIEAVRSLSETRTIRRLLLGARGDLSVTMAS